MEKLKDMTLPVLIQTLCEAVYEAGKAFGKDGTLNLKQSPTIQEIRTEIDERIAGIMANQQRQAGLLETV